MNYTLDSFKHAKAVLESIGKTFVLRKPILQTELSAYAEPQPNKFYFGVMTFGKQAENLKFYFQGNEVIEITQNSQIYLLFDSVKGFNSENEVEDLKAHFRGFEIITK